MKDWKQVAKDRLRELGYDDEALKNFLFLEGPAAIKSCLKNPEGCEMALNLDTCEIRAMVPHVIHDYLTGDESREVWWYGWNRRDEGESGPVMVFNWAGVRRWFRPTEAAVVRAAECLCKHTPQPEKVRIRRVNDLILREPTDVCSLDELMVTLLLDRDYLRGLESLDLARAVEQTKGK